MLNLTHVRTFLAIVDENGVRAAAKALNLSPSTVVEHIKQLETDLSAQLVVRNRGANRVTFQGERFLVYARALIATAVRVKELIDSSVIRMAAASNIGIYLLQQPLAAFRQTTGTEIELWIGPNPAVAERLACGAADVVAMEWWDNRKGYCATRWSREPLVVIVPPGHRWSQRKSLTIDELVEEPLLGGEVGSGTGTLLRTRLGPLADRLRTISGFGSTEAVKRAVRAGYGVSIVLAAAVTDETARGQLEALEITGIDLVKELWLVTPDQIPPTSPSMLLISELRSWSAGTKSADDVANEISDLVLE